MGNSRSGFYSEYVRNVLKARTRHLVLPFEDWEPHLFDRIKLINILSNQCHWPYGDPYENSFAMCGLPVYRHSYCKGHYKRAHPPTGA